MIDSVEWLAEIVMGIKDAKTTAQRALLGKLKPSQQIPSMRGGVYQIYLTARGGPWVATETYRLYVCETPDGRIALAKISAKADPTGALLAETMTRKAAQLLRDEAEMLLLWRKRSVNTDQNQIRGGRPALFHHNLFPEVIEVVQLPDGRTVSILGYSEVIGTLEDIDPISRLMMLTGGVQTQRIDIKSCWILTKTLKALNWAHGEAALNGALNASNILISTSTHAVFVFDWSHALQFRRGEGITGIYREVATAGQIFATFAGGRWEGDHLVLPHDTHITDAAGHERFRDYLERLSLGAIGDAYTAHTELFAIADTLWPPMPNAEGVLKRPFHPFVLYPMAA